MTPTSLELYVWSLFKSNLRGAVAAGPLSCLNAKKTVSMNQTSLESNVPLPSKSNLSPDGQPSSVWPSQSLSFWSLQSSVVGDDPTQPVNAPPTQDWVPKLHSPDRPVEQDWVSPIWQPPTTTHPSSAWPLQLLSLPSLHISAAAAAGMHAPYTPFWQV